MVAVWLPERIRDRIEERRLEKRIAEIAREFRGRMAAARTEQEEHSIDHEWTETVEEDFGNLGVLKTKRLLRLTEKWEIEIPQDAWTHDRYENSRYISPLDQVKLRRSIRAARREATKWWIQLLTPIVSALTGLAGALIGLLTYLHKA